MCVADMPGKVRLVATQPIPTRSCLATNFRLVFVILDGDPLNYSLVRNFCLSGSTQNRWAGRNSPGDSDQFPIAIPEDSESIAAVDLDEFPTVLPRSTCP